RTIGVTIAIALALTEHATPVRLVRIYLVTNLALGLALIGFFYEKVDYPTNVGRSIGASLPSLVWLVYFIKSKRVNATYYGAEPLFLTPQIKTRHKRIAFILAGLSTFIVATLITTWLAFNAFQKNLDFYFSPTQITAKEVPIDRSFRIGGLVANGSLKRDGDGLTVRFTLTDTLNSVPVIYKGILPDLFKEG